MITKVLDDCAAAFGRTISRAAAVAVAAGALALALGAALGLTGAALGSLAAAWLFCAGLAAGGLAVAATIDLTSGRWAGAVLPIARATIGFFVPAIVLLAVIALTAALWMPKAVAPEGMSLARLAGRNLVATALLLWVARRYVDASQAAAGVESRLRRRAVGYLLLYVVTLSLWAVDFVIGLTTWAPSSVIPAFYFMGAFLGGIAWVALIGALAGSPITADTRHDLGKLIFAFGAFWGYLLWSAFLPVWYGNLPEETGQLIARWDGPWRFVTVGMFAAVFGTSFGFFFPESTKRGRITLAVGSAVVLAGLLGERFLLVLPSLSLRGSAGAILVGAAVTAGVLGAFVLLVGARLGRSNRAFGAPGRRD